MAVPTSPAQRFSSVGGDYSFVEINAWPEHIVHITNNAFCASQPYPVSRRYPTQREYCECLGGRCLVDNAPRRNSSCINVLQDIVCDDAYCFLGPSCGNRMQQNFNLDLISTRVGLGVVCGTTIPKDSFIIEYVGEVLLGPEAQQRTDQRYQVELKAKASWDGPQDVYIDAARCGNESRFINHSCNPNCKLYELEWANTSRLGIFANEDIPPLRELTFRYRESNRLLFRCQCGAINCISKFDPKTCIFE
ncbi:hypothetical protein L915_11501 [Phytophthora nicotianae]|uniref:SET domain-containing protein n=1 Tax=Phytophthora nicotianae TaxID=4792 RepID=W2GLQ7_PHYNI|nr:hypothetical protein L915_11501 [Phytophthora nicotianae]